MAYCVPLPPPRDALPAHCRELLGVLIYPEHCRRLDEVAWDRLIRAARSARLLGTLATRLAASGLDASVPPLARKLLDAALIESSFRRQKMRFLLRTVDTQLGDIAHISVVLKGAAYELQDAPIACGRMPADVDLLVPKDVLGAAEVALLQAGWEFAKTDDYDQRYYRDWSHELPPLRYAGQALELDLHHAILPPIGRLRPDSSRLIAQAIAIPGHPFRALSAKDQLLHAAAHLFEDSDCTNRLRDLVDFDGLLRSQTGQAAPRDVAERLRARAHELGLMRPLLYAAAFAARWCDTPGAADLLASTKARRLHRPASAVVALMGCALGPPAPDQPTSGLRHLCERLLALRALWLRMPPWLVVFHTAAKTWRSVLALRRSADRGAD
jgi:hypothetical protein